MCGRDVTKCTAYTLEPILREQQTQETEAYDEELKSLPFIPNMNALKFAAETT